jgi:hypothetical protein
VTPPELSPRAPAPSADRSSRPPRWIAAAATCALLAVVHTWPLASAPGTWSRNDNGDAMLNEWILAWVEHQLPRVPAHLFQGNIFYPAHDTLAFSEPLIVPALLGAPVAWLGGSPVLVFNLLLMAGFALTAFSAWWLVVRWTGDPVAGMLAATVFAFNSHTLTRLPHVQAVHLYGLPLALLAADRLVIGLRTRDALWLAAWMAVLACTSGYLVVFGIVMIAIAVAARAADWLPRAARATAVFGIAAAASAAAMLPVSLPYLRVAREAHMVRSLEDAASYSATLTNYIAAAGSLHMATWSAHFFDGPMDAFFPGFLALALGGVALAAGVTGRGADPIARRRVLMLVAIAAAGVVLSFGTRTPIYGWLYRVFPPMQGLRASSRFGNLFLLGIAALAGLGLAWLRATMTGSRGPGSRDRRRPVLVAAVAIVAAANLEALRAPFHYSRFDGIPNIYAMLRDAPGPVVLAEIPFYPPLAIFMNAEYVLASTAHWRPLLNGYSGYIPESYFQYARAFASFPSDEAIGAMRRAHVTHVMVHIASVEHDPDELQRQLGARPELELLAAARGGLRLYRLR